MRYSSKNSWLALALLGALAFVVGDIEEDRARVLDARKGLGLVATPVTANQTNPATKARLVGEYGRLPLQFEPNHGQINGEVRFLARGSGYGLFLTPREAVLSVSVARAEGDGGDGSSGLLSRTDTTRQAVLRMKFLGANPDLKMTGQERLPGNSNYFVGQDPDTWQSNVPHFAKVRYQQIYPGIDLLFYGNQGQLEYDFIVEPGGDPGTIELSFDGADEFEIDGEDNLVLQLPGGQITQRAPVIYQMHSETRRQIHGRYVARGEHGVGFEVASYDRTKPLVIDPVLYFSSYLGDTHDDTWPSIAVDEVGNSYVTGITEVFFPVGYYTVDHVFVAKIGDDGALIYWDVLGGISREWGFAIAADSSGNAYVTGKTSSYDFPTTPGSFQESCPPPPAGEGTCAAAFVTKLSADGSELVYSTFLSGGQHSQAKISANDEGHGIAVDSLGNAFVTGVTHSDLFPTTPGAFQRTFGGAGDGFVTKLNSTGTDVVYSTYLGGTGSDEPYDIAIDTDGNAYVTGTTRATCSVCTNDFPTENPIQGEPGSISSDAFVTKINPNGEALVYSTYLGGSDFDTGWDIAVDRFGNSYVTGQTKSTDFPVQNALQPEFSGAVFGTAYISKLNPEGSAFQYSTYFRYFTTGYAIDADADGSAYIASAGYIASKPHADAAVAVLDPVGSRIKLFGLLGGSMGESARDVAIGPNGDIYLTGYTDSDDFPTVNPFQAARAGLRDVFVARIADQVQNDFNADRRSDILWRHATSGKAVLWEMDGFAREDAGSIGSVDTVWQVEGLADFNADTKTDVLWRHTGNGNIAIWLMDGEARLDAGVVGGAGPDWQVVGTGDFDGDDHADLLWRNIVSGAAVIWKMDGLVRVSVAPLGRVSLDWQVEGVGDLDADAISDIVWRNMANSVTVAWKMADLARDSWAVIGGAPAVWAVEGLADFDGDAKSDILWHRADSGATAIWKMNGLVREEAQVIGAPDVVWRVDGLGDTNGDRKTDIIWRHTANATAFIWQMNGFFREDAGSIGAPPMVWEVQ